MKTLKPFLPQILMVIGAIMALKGMYLLIDYYVPHDNTDDIPHRSGMRLYTDHLTGCQYLRMGIFGGTVPRLKAEGGHLCLIKEESHEESIQQ